MTENIVQAIEKLRNEEKRNFSQTFDLIVSLKELDLKKPENKFSEDFILPHGRGKEAKVVVFSDNIKNADCEVLGNSEIQRLANEKRKIRKMVKETDFFLAEAQLMPLIGKVMGQTLAPKGKMPKILSGNISELVKNLKSSIKIRVKDTPVIQCMVGNEDMKTGEVAKNIESVLRFLETKLPQGRHNIKKVMLKLTMNKPIEVVV